MHVIDVTGIAELQIRSDKGIKHSTHSRTVCNTIPVSPTSSAKFKNVCLHSPIYIYGVVLIYHMDKFNSFTYVYIIHRRCHYLRVEC
jgi:hypothetical protein